MKIFSKLTCVVSLLMLCTAPSSTAIAKEIPSENPPGDAGATPTASDREHGIEGFFVQLGPAGGLEIGEERVLDPGPGLHFGAGYMWDLLGLRASVTYLSLEPDGLNDIQEEVFDVDFVNFSADLLIFPFFKSDFLIQPYFVVGPGYYHLAVDTDDLGVDGDIDSEGFGGNLGLGANIRLAEHVAVGIENNVRPVIFCSEDCDDTEDAYFYTFAAFGTVFF